MSKDSATEKIVRDYLIEKALEVKESNGAHIDKKAAAAAGRDLLYMQELDKTLAKIFHKGWCVPPKYTGKRLHSPHKRIENLILSDLHIGGRINPEECPIGYDTISESRRLGKVGEQIAEYKTQYRTETKLAIHGLGDFIQNQLHDPRDGDPLAIQFCSALQYVTQLVLFCASEYSKVDVMFTPGNHGRNMARHPERPINEKFDGIETMLYYAVKTAVLNSGVAGVSFTIPKTPYYTYNMFGAKGFYTHGDTVIRPGYPGKTINIAGLYSQICKFNSARNIGGPFKVFAVGHVHVGSVTNLPGGVTMITNGALTPPDAFSVSIGNLDNVCGQWLFESTEKYPVGDQRFIVVDGAEKESKYNDIIKPFQGL